VKNKKAQKVVQALLCDLGSRAGFNQLLWGLKDDVKQEMRETWTYIVQHGHHPMDAQENPCHPLQPQFMFRLKKSTSGSVSMHIIEKNTSEDTMT
jgi:hypothetical protein